MQPRAYLGTKNVTEGAAFPADYMQGNPRTPLTYDHAGNPRIPLTYDWVRCPRTMRRLVSVTRPAPPALSTWAGPERPCSTTSSPVKRAANSCCESKTPIGPA